MSELDDGDTLYTKADIERERRTQEENYYLETDFTWRIKEYTERDRASGK